PVASNGNSAPFCAAVCSFTGLRACDASRARHPPRLLALVARLPPRPAAREASAERAHRRLQSIAGHRRHDDQSVDAHLGRALDQLGRQRLEGGEGYLERLRPAAELDAQPPELADDRRRAVDREAEAVPPAREVAARRSARGLRPPMTMGGCGRWRGFGSKRMPSKAATRPAKPGTSSVQSTRLAC